MCSSAVTPVTRSRLSTMTATHPAPVAMVLVFACLLNSSHHPACSASSDCSGEVELYKNEKEKATKEADDCKWNLKQCEKERADLAIQNKSSSENREKLTEELRRCRGSGEASDKNNAVLWTNILGVGALLFLLSIAFNVVQFFINQQAHGKETEAERCSAAFEAELNALKKNPFHNHAQMAYMMQFEKFSQTQLGIDMRPKVAFDASLGITNGGGVDVGGGRERDGGGGRERDGGGGRERDGGGGRSDHGGGGGVGDDCQSSNGPASMPPVQDTDGVRYRRNF